MNLSLHYFRTSYSLQKRMIFNQKTINRLALDGKSLSPAVTKLPLKEMISNFGLRKPVASPCLWVLGGFLEPKLHNVYLQLQSCLQLIHNRLNKPESKVVAHLFLYFIILFHGLQLLNIYVLVIHTLTYRARQDRLNRYRLYL